MTIWRKGLAPISVAALAFSVLAMHGAVAGEMETKTTLQSYKDSSVIEGTEAALLRMDNGVSVTVDTVDLKAGDAVTMWWVVFNEPQKCSDGECGENDVFNLDDKEDFVLNDDGSPPFNQAGIEAAQISINYADGHVIDEGGAAKFGGQLPVGDTTRADIGPGLLDPMKAEIHIVLRSHQQAIPGQVDEMIYTVNGGCAAEFPNLPCEDVQFSVFKAPAAPAN